MNRHKQETPLLHAYFYLHNRMIPLAHARVLPLAHMSTSPRTRKCSPSHTCVHYLLARHGIKSVPYASICDWI